MSGTQVYFGPDEVPLEQLRVDGYRAAASLRARGILEGATAAILMRNEPQFLAALSCVRALGARRMMIPWHLTPAEVAPILTTVRPSIIIVHRDLLPLVTRPATPSLRPVIVVIEVPEVVRRIYPNDRETAPSPVPIARWTDLVSQSSKPLAVPGRPRDWISVTSGSTGHPKIICWDQPPPWMQWRDRRAPQRPPIITSIITAPLYHGGQFGAYSHASGRNAAQVILPKFEPEAFLATVERHRVNHAYMVPNMFVRLLKLPPAVRSRYDTSSLNYILHTGAACPPEIKRQMIDWLGPVLWEAYGCTESSVIAACSSAEWLNRPGTVGKPGLPVRIVNRDSSRCPANEVGEILVNIGSMPPLHYAHGQPAIRTLDGEPWFAPGDAGYLDEEGYLFVEGRTDDLINTGRIKVYPLEVENSILQHPAVRDCVVFGLPDPDRGQQIAAAVEVSDGTVDIDALLRRFLQGRISGLKIPTVFMPLAHGIRTATGKTNRNVLIRSLQKAADATWERAAVQAPGNAGGSL